MIRIQIMVNGIGRDLGHASSTVSMRNFWFEFEGRGPGSCYSFTNAPDRNNL